MGVIQKSKQNSSGVPWMAWVSLLVMIAILVQGGFFLFRLPNPFDTQKRIDMTWAILKTEKMSFLTTQRQEWQANINTAQGNWYGVEESQGTIMADIFYGFDMQALSEDDIKVEEDGTVVIHFPTPKILTLSLRPETYSAVTKRTGLMKLKTLLDDGDEEAKARMQSLKRDVLMDMLQNQRLNFDELKEGIEQFLGPIFDKQGIPYRIEFPDRAPSNIVVDYLKENA